jgi:LemA protein
MDMHRIIVACFLLLLIGACGAEIAPPGDADVKVAFAEVVDQYARRVDTSRELIHMVRVVGSGGKFDLGPVEAACVNASGSAVAGILNDSIAFEKDEVAQGRLADLLSGLLIRIDKNRRLRIDPEYQRLKAKLASEERRIGEARQRYNDAARSYNEKLLSFPRSSFAGAMHYASKPALVMSDKSVRPPPRRDFGALRGRLQV